MKKGSKLLLFTMTLIMLLTLPFESGSVKAATIHEVSGSNAIIDSIIALHQSLHRGCPGRSSMAVEVMIPVLYFVTKVLLVDDYQRTVTSHCYPVML